MSVDLPYTRRMATRFRCDGCGNLTRFDVEATRRTREFHHYTVGGELDVEESEIVEEHIEAVTCRWCGAGGDTIEHLEVGDVTSGNETVAPPQG